MSTEPSQHSTPSAPDASAERSRVPALPGSRTSTATTTSRAARRSARGASTKGTTASSGCGVTVSATRSRTPGASGKTRAPAAMARSTTSSTAAPTATYTDSTSMPASSASPRTFAPSTTKTRSCSRALRRLRSRRRRWTRGWRRASGARSGRLAVTGTAGHLDEAGEGGGVADGEVGEHLAVDLDVGQLQPVDQPRVAHAVLPGSGVDALDPELAEVALAGSPVPERVVPGVHELLVGGAEAAALVAVVALRLLEDGPAVLLAVDGALDPCHGALLSVWRGVREGWRSGVVPARCRAACGPAWRRRR